MQTVSCGTSRTDSVRNNLNVKVGGRNFDTVNLTRAVTHLENGNLPLHWLSCN